MKQSAKSIRIYLLACLLLVGLYLLYRQARSSQASETAVAGLDTSDFSLQAIPKHIEALKSQDTQGAMMISLAHFGPEVKRALPTLQAAAKAPENQKNETRMKQINQALKSIEVNVKNFEARKSDRK